MPFNELSLKYTNSLAGHFHLGVQIGRGTKDLIDQALPLDSTLQSLLHSVRESPMMTSRMKLYQQVLSDTYPDIFQELRGMAAGAEIDFDTVFICNYRKELATDDKGCTDVHSSVFNGWGHNEDYSWSPEFRPLTILTVSRMDASGCIIATWWSIVYPLCLGGMTVGMNSHGVVFSVDNLTPAWTLGPEDGAVSSQVVCRLALESRDSGDFVDRVTDKRLSSGRGFSFGSFHDKIVKYIETGPGGVHYIKENPEGHTNHYIYLNDLNKRDSASSFHRLATLNRYYKQTTTEEDILKALSDTTDEDWPIFRTGKHPDRGYTDFTALIDLTQARISLYYSVPYDKLGRPDEIIEFSTISR